MLMPSPTVSFGCTALVGTNKRGVLKCDGDGYYPVVMGALNHYNSAGAFYPLGPAKALFDSSSSFMRRIASGALHGECGHPRKQRGDSDRDYALRLNDIYEPNIAFHIRRVWLEEGHRDEAGRPIILTMGEIRPAGPRGSALKEALENRFADVCFSIRSFTNDFPVGMTMHKHIRQIVTWDWVNEPGISAAHKWRAPSLESFEEAHLTRELVLAMSNEKGPYAVGLESQREAMRELAQALGWTRCEIVRPASDQW